MWKGRRTKRAGAMIVAAWLVAALSTSSARAEIVEVTVPLQLDAGYLREAVVSQVYTDAGESARVWDDGSGCNHMILSEPLVATVEERVQLQTRGEARIGKAFGERCVLVVDWAGTLQTLQSVSVEPGGAAVRFEVVDSSLVDGGTLGGTFWNLVKDHVHPRIGAVRIDLMPPLAELKAVLPLLLPGDPAVVADIIESVSVKSVVVNEGGLEVVLGFSVQAADAVPQAPSAPEPALDAEEMARFQEATRSWDSFITFIVKYLAATAVDVNVRRDLLYVLIEARYDILRILGDELDTVGPDPVRDLFLRTWSRLSPVLRQLSPTTPGQQGLNLLSFIAAADALSALDAIGPRLELELTADGLRRMARVLAPESNVDPLLYDEGVDPRMREMFDFRSSPVPREIPEHPGLDDVPVDDADQEPLGFLPGLLMHDAFANVGPDERLVARLNRWVPEPAEISDYLPLVRDLLVLTAEKVAGESELDPTFHRMFRAMVLATAWQETCWRQFIRDGGKVVPVRSAGGAVGMMQVIPSVWRGFYDARGLTRDIAYNAAAGSEILMHYLVDYAIARGEHQHEGGARNLPRAAYAAYNGGPGHLRRYRTGQVAESLRRIDRSYYEKYRAIFDGNDLAVTACFSE